MVCNAKEDKSIPKWLYENISTGPPSPDELSEARDELYKALSLFQTHVRWLIGIMFSLITATIGAIIGRTQAHSIELISYLKIISYAIIIGALIVALLSVVILYRYYSVYVSALIFAVRQHLISKDSNKHPWLNRTVKQAKDWAEAAKTEEGFLRKRVLSITDSFVLYAIIIVALSLMLVWCVIFLIIYL